MSGRKSRNKGKRGELEALEELRGSVLAPLLQNIKRNTAQTQEGGLDVVGDVVKVNVEIKRQERIGWSAALEQCHRGGDPSLPSIVLGRESRKPWKVLLTLEDLERIIKALSE